MIGSLTFRHKFFCPLVRCTQTNFWIRCQDIICCDLTSYLRSKQNVNWQFCVGIYATYTNVLEKLMLWNVVVKLINICKNEMKIKTKHKSLHKKQILLQKEYIIIKNCAKI